MSPAENAMRRGAEQARMKGTYRCRSFGTLKGNPSRVTELRVKELTAPEIAQATGLHQGRSDAT